MTERIIPLLLICVFAVTLFKKQKAYDIFVSGASQSFKLVLGVFPYLVTMFLMTEFFTLSGLNTALIDLLGGLFNFFGIEKQLIPLVLLKPFSGSGSLSLLSEIMQENGVDSYISRVASTIYASQETIFYISAVYYSACKEKPKASAFLIVLFSNFVSIVFACFICKIL